MLWIVISSLTDLCNSGWKSRILTMELSTCRIPWCLPQLCECGRRASSLMPFPHVDVMEGFWGCNHEPIYRQRNSVWKVASLAAGQLFCVSWRYWSTWDGLVLWSCLLECSPSVYWRVSLRACSILVHSSMCNDINSPSLADVNSTNPAMKNQSRWSRQGANPLTSLVREITRYLYSIA